MKFLLPLLCLAILLSGCSIASRNAGPQDIALIGPDKQAVTLTVEIADSPEEWTWGLQGRTSLEEGHGMMFLFPQPQILSFWMKDTLIPLDIIFFDSQGKVVSSKTMTPCAEDPCPRYSSDGPATIALEVPAGFVREYRVGKAWRIGLPSVK